MPTVSFTTTIQQFEKQGSTTGWTYIEIPADIVQKIKPGFRKIYRVKGKLDGFAIKAVAIMPFGDGRFMLPVNAAMRKGIGKRKGAMVKVQLQEDKTELPVNKELLECLADDAEAMAGFKKLSKSNQLYFSKWIDSAKTEPTKTARLTRTLIALGKGWDYGQMMRAAKKTNDGW
jgi:hypothetical protein